MARTLDPRFPGYGFLPLLRSKHREPEELHEERSDEQRNTHHAERSLPGGDEDDAGDEGGQTERTGVARRVRASIAAPYRSRAVNRKTLTATIMAVIARVR